MRNLLPAVLIGGPPHAGKSVLTYALRQALRKRGIDHYLLRACPDREGNWFHEGDPKTVGTLRLPPAGTWPAGFRDRIKQDLEHRCLPFLVDMGGRPRPVDKELFRNGTHAILLLRADCPEATEIWQQIIDDYNLSLQARLFSRREGPCEITAYHPLLEGTVGGLERQTKATSFGPAFDEMVERIATLFLSYDLHNQKQVYLEHAPTEVTLDLDNDLRTFTALSSWELEMLQPYLDRLPQEVPLSAYGAGPNWLYAALAAHTHQRPFYQFDPKLPFGWIQPARVCIGNSKSPDVDIQQYETQDMTTLTITFPQERIEYFQPDILNFPAISRKKGMIIHGRLPYWLLTALTRLYQADGVPWIAPFYAPQNKAIVVYSRVPFPHLGTTISHTAR